MKIFSILLDKLKNLVSWHVFPTKADLGLKSMIEVVFYFLIAIALFLTYNLWHEVPVRTIVLQTEFEPNKAHTDMDTIFKTLNIQISIPMTKTTLDPDGQPKCVLNLSLDKSNKKNSNINLKINDSTSLSKDMEFLSNSTSYNQSENKNITETYPQLFAEKDLLYFAYGYNCNPLNTMALRNSEQLDPEKKYYSKILRNRNFFTRKNFEYYSDSLGQIISYTFTSGDLASPVWYRLEDISQSYFNIRLMSKTIDSLAFRIDFVGVVDFSDMIPQPDEQGVGYIEFRQKEKIKTIQEKGLLFHANFKELENRQTVRLLFISVLLGGIVSIGFAVLFVGFCHFFSWTRKHKKEGFAIVFIVVMLLLWYFNVLGTIGMYFW